MFPVPFMTAAATTPTPTTEPSRAGRLLDLVRKLIDYGKELAATLRHHSATIDLTAATRPFGTRDIALILARITRGLHRANALEARLVRNAARLDAAPRPRATPAAARPAAARAHAGRAAGRCTSRSPAHAGADRGRGPPPPDRCRHRRYLPRPRHHAEPSAVARGADGHDPARRQPRQPGPGPHPPVVSVARPGRRARRIAGTVPASVTRRHRPALTPHRGPSSVPTSKASFATRACQTTRSLRSLSRLTKSRSIRQGSR